jgi:hypothetical protein
MKILIPAVIWLVVFVSAFLVFQIIEPTGSGFTRGTNRLPPFFGLQCLAFVIALVTAFLAFRSRGEVAGWQVVTGFAPLVIHSLLIVLVVVAYGIAIITTL